jgi:hypothetical protein
VFITFGGLHVAPMGSRPACGVALQPQQRASRPLGGQAEVFPGSAYLPFRPPWLHRGRGLPAVFRRLQHLPSRWRAVGVIGTGARDAEIGLVVAADLGAGSRGGPVARGANGHQRRVLCGRIRSCACSVRRCPDSGPQCRFGGAFGFFGGRVRVQSRVPRGGTQSRQLRLFQAGTGLAGGAGCAGGSKAGGSVRHRRRLAQPGPGAGSAALREPIGAPQRTRGTLSAIRGLRYGFA